jgi:hypothetical protein
MTDYSQPIEYVSSTGEILEAETVDDAVRIVLASGSAQIVFADKDGRCWGREGTEWLGRIRNIPQPPAFRVDAPGRYVQRDGQLATMERIVPDYGPYVALGRDADGTRRSWTQAGRYRVEETHRLDLIAKAPQPPARIEAPGTYTQRDGRLAWAREIVPLDIEYPVRGCEADGYDASWTIYGELEAGDENDYDLLPESR